MLWADQAATPGHMTFPMNPLDTASALFLQPHYDDVALSCGGTAALLATGGKPVTIITVCASDIVATMVDDFAAWKHERWRISDPDEVVRIRRAEDQASADALGCDLRWLGIPDAIYRGERYTSDADLFGPIHAEELEMADHMAEELVGLPEWREGNTVFVPLGVGGHVDHRIAFATGAALADRGVTIFAYVDCPYAIHTPSGVPARLAEVGDRLGSPVTVPVADEAFERRLAAIACYTSQVPIIFRFTDDWRAAVRRFAEETGDGRPAERFWRVRPC